MGLLLFVAPLQAELSGIDIRSRTLLSEPDNPVRYELISGVLYFTLDPLHPGNQKIVDIQHAPLNSQGRTEFSADFKLLVPRGQTQSTSLLYHVNNRGGSHLPPEVSLSHPLAMQGHTFLATGWINEMPPADGRLRLFAPVLTHNGDPLIGRVRYEIIPASHGNDLNIAGSFHLAYPPVASALPDTTLSVRPRQDAERRLLARDQFSLNIEDVTDSNQPLITLNLEGGMQAGHIYELMYDAQGPVLSGAGLAGIRDVSLLQCQCRLLVGQRLFLVFKVRNRVDHFLFRVHCGCSFCCRIAFPKAVAHSRHRSLSASTSWPGCSDNTRYVACSTWRQPLPRVHKAS
jgi:hypothetical protein